MPPGGAASGSMSSASSANLRGAVDLSTLGAPKSGMPGAGSAAGAGAGGASAGNPWAVTMTEQSFPQMIEASSQVPVLVAVVDPAQAESARVLGLLDQVVQAARGKLLLAAVDAAQNPNIVQAFQVQALPTVVAVLKSQPVPLFSGPISEDELASLLQQLMTLAAQQGVNGQLPGGDATATANAGDDAPLPPLHQEAFDAIEKGDYAAAEAAYTKALAESPADQDAQVGLVQVGLLKRTADIDSAEVREAGAEQPDDLDAQLVVADLDMVGGHVEDAFKRLLTFIGTHFGEERDGARARLVDFFALVGPSDPRVVKARGKLAALLF